MSRPAALPLWPTILASAAAVGLFFAAGWIVPDWIAGGSGRLALHEAVQIALAAALLGFVLRVERVPAASIGLRRPGWSTLGWGLVGAVGSILAGGAAIALAYAAGLGGAGDARLAQLTTHPVWAMLLVALTAGITEEIAFRGVLIDHLARLAGGRTMVGAALSVLVFAALHISAWGPVQFLLVLPPAVVLTGVFLRTRDLGACVLAHALTDVIGLLSFARGHGG